ncbi:MAG: hypothetical protein AB7P52_06680 [Alphaproteobacteria bacterium]
MTRLASSLAAFGGALYPAATLGLYIPIDAAQRNAHLFRVPDGYFAIVLCTFFALWLFVAVALLIGFRGQAAINRIGYWLAGVLMVLSVLTAFSSTISDWPSWLAIALDVVVAILLMVAIARIGLRRIGPYLAMVGVGMGLFGGFKLVFSDWDVTSAYASKAPYTHPDVYFAAVAPSRDAGNVYHILLDGFQSQAFEAAVEAVGVSESFQDFVLYPNAVSESWSTQYSVPMMAASRRVPDGANWAEWENAAFQEGFAARLADAGIVVSQTVHDPFECLRGSYCRHHAEYVSINAFWFYVDLWFLNSMPGGLRALAGERSDYPGRDGGWSTSFSLAHAVFGIDDAEAFSHYPAISARLMSGVIADEEQRTDHGNYVFAHVMAPHKPWVLDANCAYRPRRSAAPEQMALDQHACALKLVSDLVETLKRMRRYDASLIVIHSDHGHHGHYRSRGVDGQPSRAAFRFTTDNSGKLAETDGQGVSSEYLTSVTSALLAVKFPHARGASPNPAIYQLVDIGPTILRHFGLDAPSLEGMPILGETMAAGRESAAIYVPYGGASYQVVPKGFQEYRGRPDNGWQLSGPLALRDGGQAWRPVRERGLLESYNGYNIVALNNQMAAFRHGFGPVDIGRETIGEHDVPPFVFFGHTSGEVAEKLAAARAAGHAMPETDYSLIDADGSSFAVLKRLGVSDDAVLLGAVDMPPYILSGEGLETLHDMEERIDGFLASVCEADC